MSEILEKLRPDRDLQVYFFRPSAIAALSQASEDGFVLSGTWRQEFDWAVIEWTRDNVFEHPLFRPLPDGDLSGLTLSYRERRENCIPVDSNLFPTVDGPFLRIWAEDASGQERIYRVSLLDRASPVHGSFTPAAATFTLSGTLTPGDVIELSWLDEHYHHTVHASDSVETVLASLALNINAFSATVLASYDGAAASITLTNATPGHNANRLGIVATVAGAGSEVWTPASQRMSRGTSPDEWAFSLNFGNLVDSDAQPVPANRVRKMRWTYAAAPQESTYKRSEYAVTVSGWQVSGTKRQYRVAGPQSLRVEDDQRVEYSGPWEQLIGNYSGGTIRRTNSKGAAVEASYRCHLQHSLY